MLEQIVKQLEMPEGETFIIPAPEVRRWMSSEDVEVLGATYELLTNTRHAPRISPALAFDDVFAFLLRYYEICLTRDAEGEWADGRYSAGGELVRIFVSFWDNGKDKHYFQTIKSLLKRLYLAGDAELKKCIEHAIIEHLFEREAIREFFSDWRDNPQLRPAYEEAMLWVNGGGTSPLTERRQR